MSKYKYPKASAGRIRLMHPAMMQFQSLPWIRVHPWYQFVAVGAFLAIMALALVVMTIGHWEKGLSGLIIVVIAFAIAIPTFYQIIIRFHRMLMIRQANEDRQAFKATPEERPIGIAYCDHVWAFRDDTSWDRGFVRIEDNCLCFRGFGPEFQLPLESIQDTWIAMQATVLDQSPRLYIRWSHPDSGTNVLSLEYRAYKSLLEANKETENLKQWIDDNRKSASTADQNPVWPFESSQLDFANNPDKQKVEPADRLVAFLAALGIYVVVVVISALLKTDGGIAGGVAAPFMIATYYGIIQRRVVKRGKPKTI